MAVVVKGAYVWTRLTLLLGVVVLAIGVLYLGPLPSVEAASCGDVQVGGASWASGSGVDSHSNAPYDGDISGNDCKVNNPTASYNPYFNTNPDSGHNGGVAQWGDGWQCVELAQRMYQIRGWTSYGGAWPNIAKAADLYTQASNLGMTATANGSIVLANVKPGDMLVTHEATFGHVMLVDSVNTSTNKINAVDQNGADGGRTTVTFSNGSLSDGTYYVFSGVVHDPDNKLGSGGGGSPPSTPTALSRASTNMAVFYNDGNDNLVNYSWDVNSGWSSAQWADAGGVRGQIAAVTRTSDSMDVFYRTGQSKLVNKGWTAAGGWSGPNTLLGSDVVGDPAVVARDSGDMQVFYRDGAGDIKSIYWSSTGGWNTNPQLLYSAGAAGDPVAISRTSDSMDAFFVKNNENLVHLGWSASGGWNALDWTTYMTGKPTAITWNSGGDMAAFYEQINNNVGEESWDWQTGWAAQTWVAALSGNPSAVVGVSHAIDNLYRDTGGNVEDRYLSGSSWLTTNIVGANGSTSNPYGIRRGTTSEEVFYWNGTALMDNNWNTTSQSWNGGVKIN